jgi:hypothetical protein
VKPEHADDDNRSDSVEFETMEKASSFAQTIAIVTGTLIEPSAKPGTGKET